jgi:pimeloyl-ACP methyl ester carboxylesterase
MKRLVDSSENHDCRKDLEKITAPTLVVSSQYDFLVPLLEQEYLVKHIKNAQHVIIPDSGHASMYEKPLIFTALTLGFANAKDDEYVI